MIGKEMDKDMNRDVKNHMRLSMLANSVNESLARLTIAGFASVLNPTLEEMEDIKTAVSEAVTNAIVHGYRNVEPIGEVILEAYIEKSELTIYVKDLGVGIADISKAMEPLYTTAPQEERSGMGFSFMEAFMDSLEVKSRPGDTVVCMKKYIGKGEIDV